MKDVPQLTVQDLENRRTDALAVSEKAALAHPAVYRQIRRMLNDINSGPVDVAEYYQTARKLSKLLETLNSAGGRTLFEYYVHQIDPSSSGDPRYFRWECRDLAAQLDGLEKWSAKRHNLRVIK